MTYLFGHEEEGFFDILTGRPRYPIAKYNVVRQDRVEKRKGALTKKKPFNVKSPLLRPEGSSYQVPGLQKFWMQAKKR